jgi:hypothetical protein
MTKFLLFIMLSFTPKILPAQTLINPTSPDMSPLNIVDFIDMLNLRNQVSTHELQYDGSPFLHDEFINGDIYYDHQYIYRDIPLRYNIYLDEMQYNYKDVTYSFEPKTTINKIVIESDTFIVSTLNKYVRDSLSFFKVLASGKLSILEHFDIYLKEGKPAGALMDHAEPPKFLAKPKTYFAMFEGSRPEKIKNIKSIISASGDKQKKMSDYAKKEKINSVKPKDLIHLATYYNSI